MSKDTFKFVMPAELSKNSDGEWKIAGLASTSEVDLQGETIIQKGIDLSPIDQKKGYFNFEHGKGPENLIGTIDGYSQGSKGLYVSGRLFKNHDKAKAVHQIMSSLGSSDSGRVGMSVEGQIIERDPFNDKIIKKCRINKVAITMNPVNSHTYADLVKSLSSSSDIEFNATKNQYPETTESELMFSTAQVLDIIKKALSVSTGYTKAPNELTNGDAMATSSMTSIKGKKKKKKEMPIVSSEIYKSMMIDVLEQLQVLYPNNSRSELWEAVKVRLETRFPDIYAANNENQQELI